MPVAGVVSEVTFVSLPHPRLGFVAEEARMTITTEQRGPLVRAFADSWDAPRPERLARMSERYTFGLVGSTLAALLVADLSGFWSLAVWWTALAEWAPFGVLVTVAMVLGWQLALSHALLGAVGLLRHERGVGDPRWAVGASFLINGCLWLSWAISCLVIPGLREGS